MDKVTENKKTSLTATTVLSEVSEAPLNANSSPTTAATVSVGEEAPKDCSPLKNEQTQKSTKLATGQHTSGPWHVSDGGYGPVIKSGDEYIAGTSARIVGGESAELANAHLIAAAPSLLSALEEITHQMREVIAYYDVPSICSDTAAHADNVIAKAKGGSCE